MLGLISVLSPLFILVWAIWWFMACIAAAIFAHHHRNREGVAWFVFALFLSPFMAYLFLISLPSLPGGPVFMPFRASPPLPEHGGLEAVARELDM
jgi:hypothetical protein